MLDPDFLSAIGHPVRFQALVLFERTPSSARELALLVGLSSAATLYHVSKLEEAGLIEATGAPRPYSERVWRTRSTGWAELERLLGGVADGLADPS
jgi:predicted transcriptional regulator